jgi:hypothetical protein
MSRPITREELRAKILRRLTEFGELSGGALANYCNGYQSLSHLHFEPLLAELVRTGIVIRERRPWWENGPLVTYYRLAEPRNAVKSSGDDVLKG